MKNVSHNQVNANFRHVSGKGQKTIRSTFVSQKLNLNIYGNANLNIHAVSIIKLLNPNCGLLNRQFITFQTSSTPQSASSELSLKPKLKAYLVFCILYPLLHSLILLLLIILSPGNISVEISTNQAQIYI